jgi:AraC-like DNA-binding protein
LNKPDTRTVCNRIASNIWQALHADGLGAAEFTHHTGITLDDLKEPSGRLSAGQHRRFVTYLLPFSARRNLLDVGQQAWFADYPQLANLCFNSATLRTALRHLLAFRGLIGEFDYLLMRDNGNRVELEYLSEFAPHQGAPQALANFKTLAFIVRGYDQHSPTPMRLYLQGPAPAHAAAIADYFGAPVRFGQERNLLSFDAGQLDLPFAMYNSLLAPHLLLQADMALRQVRTRHQLSARVQQALRTLLAQPDVRGGDDALLTRLCDRLGMAPWTLRRALQQDGTSFRALELEVKSSEARRLLADGGLSLGEIGVRLGFSSQSAFTRFFTTQHRMPPARYRQRAP